MIVRHDLDRNTIAAYLFNGMLSNPNYMGPFTEGDPPWDDMARDAVLATDALLRALQAT